MTANHEQYRYVRQGTRLLKSVVQPAKISERREQVCYLPGLEIRTCATGERQTRNLRVVTVSATRVLHWQLGRPEEIQNNQVRFSVPDRTGSGAAELDREGKFISRELYYPFGGTAIWATRNQTEARYKTVRYSGKERDATGLLYYGYRYYAPWLARWLNADPAGPVEGVNLFCMVKNNPVSLSDGDGLISDNNDLFTAVAALASFSILAFLARKAFCWLRDRPLRTFARTFLTMAAGYENEFLINYHSVSRFAAGGGDLDETTLHIYNYRDGARISEFTCRQALQMLKSSLELSFKGNTKESYDVEAAFDAEHLLYSEKRKIKRSANSRAASDESSSFSSPASGAMNAVPATQQTGRKLRRKGPKVMPAKEPALSVNSPGSTEPQLALSLQNKLLRQKQRMSPHQTQILDGVLEHLQARDYRTVSAHSLEGFDNLYTADLRGFEGTGRGDWRLLFSRRGDTLDVHRIVSTHHGRVLKPW